MNAINVKFLKLNLNVALDIEKFHYGETSKPK